nr:hypothetical protein CFP56_30516 [Quercus suber]
MELDLKEDTSLTSMWTKRNPPLPCEPNLISESHHSAAAPPRAHDLGGILRFLGYGFWNLEKRETKRLKEVVME